MRGHIGSGLKIKFDLEMYLLYDIRTCFCKDNCIFQKHFLDMRLQGSNVKKKKSVELVKEGNVK